MEALTELLLELNPAMQVETRRLRMDEHNIGTVLPACPIWVEAFDGPDDKTLLVETALLGGYRIASASGMGGWGGKAMAGAARAIWCWWASTDACWPRPWPRASPRQRPCWQMPLEMIRGPAQSGLKPTAPKTKARSRPVAAHRSYRSRAARGRNGRTASGKTDYTLSWAVRSSRPAGASSRNFPVS